LTHPSREQRGHEDGDDGLTMKDAIKEVLRDHLAGDERVTLYGEDIADPKGDVFGVTKGLTQQFGSRVRNSPLTESTIVGVSVGRALAGERPVCFLQFADFLPIAFNQIVSELGSIHWRTDGQWTGTWTVPRAVLRIDRSAYAGSGCLHALHGGGRGRFAERRLRV